MKVGKSDHKKEIIGIIGVGRMGKVLAHRLRGGYRILLYDRDVTTVVRVAEEIEEATVCQQLGDLLGTSAIILAVPDREVVNCLKELGQFKQSLAVINIATNVDQRVVDGVGEPYIHCISVKIIGQADEMAQGGRPVVVVNHRPAELVEQATALFENIGEIMIGNADQVRRINTLAAEKALEAAVKIDLSLREKGVTDEQAIKSAIRQVAAGILKSYAENNLGPFARELVAAIKGRHV